MHVEVFRVAGVGTAIFGRPRPLSRYRRADPSRVVRYTLICEEPVMGRYPKLDPIKKIPEVEGHRSLRSEPVPTTHKLDQRLSPELVSELIAAYEAGISSIKLMKRYDLSKGSVLKLLREAGVPLRNQGIPDDAASEVIRLYAEEEWSCQRIGNRYRCDGETVRKFLRKHGVQIRPRNGWLGH